MYTIAKTEVFSRYVGDYQTENERAAFAAWISEHHDTDDIVLGSDGCGIKRLRKKHAHD